MPCAVQGREASLHQPGSFPKMQEGDGRIQTLIPKVWMTKTASPGGRAGQDPQARVWAAQECLCGEVGTVQSWHPRVFCRSRCGHSLPCPESAPQSRCFSVSGVRGRSGAPQNREFRGLPFPFCQRLKRKIGMAELTRCYPGSEVIQDKDRYLETVHIRT